MCRTRSTSFLFSVLWILGACSGAVSQHDRHDDDDQKSDEHAGGAGGGGDHDHDGTGAKSPSGTTDTAPSPDAPPKGPPTVAIQGDRWSDPATWGGRVPGNGDTVTIPAGRTILVDVDPAVLAGLRIKGTLVFADRDVALTSAYIAVEQGGRFQLGEPDRPFTKEAVITLTGRNTLDLAELPGFGSKVFAVMDGILDIHGARVGKAWTKLDADAAVGATTVTLADAPTWKAGDRIVIATSDYDQGHHDDVEVTSVAGKIVSLKTPLKYAHVGTVRKVGETTIDVRAEVGNLTRNIVIRGDEDSAKLGIGGHMMFMASEKTTVRLSNIEVTRAGQLNQLGRYPIHFHIMLDRCDGCFVKDAAVHDTVQRGIVVHDSAKILVMGNVAFNTVGHNYIVETPTTAGSTFHGNLAMVNHMPTPAITQPTLKAQNDDIPSGFWIRNAANVFTDNAVAGSQGMGMWFDDAVGGPLVFQRNTVHAAMTMGADRDFNMQSGVLLDCEGEQPASTKVTDLLVYQNGSMGAKDPAGFWPEHCTKFRTGFAPFEMSRIYAIDNASKNIELRSQTDVYTMSDVILTGSLLGGPERGTGIFAQYGGTVTLKNPTFAHWKRPVLGSNDILGPWIARFRIEGAKFIEADKSQVALPESLTEALDDSFLTRGAYLVADGNKPTLSGPDCTTMNIGDFGTYRCPKLYEMGFLLMRQGDRSDSEGEQLSGGTPLHTVMPLVRADGAAWKPTSYGFGGFEIVWNTPLSYKLDRQPTGTITGVLSPMGSVTAGQDENANARVVIPLAAAPKNVYRTGPTDASFVDALDNPRAPTAADRLKAAANAAGIDADPEGSYFYDAAAKLLHLRATRRWFVVEP